MDDWEGRPMDCTEVLAQVSQYMDDELAPDVKASISKHLVGCRTCNMRLDAETRMEQLIVRRLAWEENMPADVWERLQARIRARGGRTRRAILIAAVISAAACLLFAIGLSRRDDRRPDIEMAMVDLHHRLDRGENVPEMSMVPPQEAKSFLAAHVGDRPEFDRVAHTLSIGTHRYEFRGVASVKMMGHDIPCIEYVCCGLRICVIFMPMEGLDMSPGMQATLARAGGTMTDTMGSTHFEARQIGGCLVCFVSEHPVGDLALAYGRQ